MTFIDIDGTPGSLVAPFNPAKLDQLLPAALIAGGFPNPPTIPQPCGPENTQLNVSVPDGEFNQNQIDQIVAILNAVAADPTRNDLTDDQQELADLQNKLDNAIADIATINTPTTGLKDQVTIAGGLKDRITATNTGLKDRLLSNAAFNALGNAAKAELLHDVEKDHLTLLTDTLTLVNNVLTIILHGARADKFELKHIQDEIEE